MFTISLIAYCNMRLAKPHVQLPQNFQTQNEPSPTKQADEWHLIYLINIVATLPAAIEESG
jgi:hypothetical protein